MSHIQKALGALENLEASLREDFWAHEDLADLRAALEGLKESTIQREALPVITKNEEGVIVAVTRQDEEGRIIDVLAASDGYPHLKQKERKGAEVIQNLLGAFDNPIVRRKCANELSDEAIAQARDLIEEHDREEEKRGWDRDIEHPGVSAAQTLNTVKADLLESQADRLQAGLEKLKTTEAAKNVGDDRDTAYYRGVERCIASLRKEAEKYRT